MKETAKRAALATLIVGGIVVVALALWKLKLLLALLFLAFILAAAMRPAVDWLAGKGIPRALGILAHYLLFVGGLVGFLWLIVPRAIDQLDTALGSGLDAETEQSTGIKHDVLVGLQRRLEDLPSGESLVDPAVEVTRLVVEIGLGIFSSSSPAPPTGSSSASTPRTSSVRSSPAPSASGSGTRGT